MKKTVVALGVIVGILGATVGVSAQSNDAWIPGLASFVLPGLGQVLNDDIDKAILHFGVDVGIIALGWYVGGLLPYGYLAIPTLHLAWAVYSGYDAYNVAKEQNFTIGVIPNGLAFSGSF